MARKNTNTSAQKPTEAAAPALPPEDLPTGQLPELDKAVAEAVAAAINDPSGKTFSAAHAALSAAPPDLTELEAALALPGAVAVINGEMLPGDSDEVAATIDQLRSQALAVPTGGAVLNADLAAVEARVLALLPEMLTADAELWSRAVAHFGIQEATRIKALGGKVLEEVTP